MYGRVNQSLLGPGPNNTPSMQSYNNQHPQPHNQYQQPLLMPSNMHHANLSMIHSNNNNRLQQSSNIMDYNNKSILFNSSSCFLSL